MALQLTVPTAWSPVWPAETISADCADPSEGRRASWRNVQGTTQSKWLHSIPKRQSSVQPRINITFRKAMSADGTSNYHRYNIGGGPVFRLGKAGKMEPASL